MIAVSLCMLVVVIEAERNHATECCQHVFDLLKKKNKRAEMIRIVDLHISFSIVVDRTVEFVVAYVVECGMTLLNDADNFLFLNGRFKDCLQVYEHTSGSVDVRLSNIV
jgi:hypothetical protein